MSAEKTSQDFPKENPQEQLGKLIFLDFSRRSIMWDQGGGLVTSETGQRVHGLRIADLGR